MFSIFQDMNHVMNVKNFDSKPQNFLLADIFLFIVSIKIFQLSFENIIGGHLSHLADLNFLSGKF